MRILFTSDLHGRKSHYLSVARAAVEHRVEAVLLGGDLMAVTGNPFTSDSRQRRFLEEFLVPWLQELRSRIPHLAVPFVLGNHDWSSNLDALQAAEERGDCARVHGRLVALGPRHQILGFQFSPPSPFFVKDLERRDLATDRGFPEESSHRALLSTPEGIVSVVRSEEYFDRHPSIEEELARLPAPEVPSRTVLLCHAPPHGTGLDVLHDGRHVGSRALRRYIESSGFLLSFHGHVHEAPEVSGRMSERIGRTLSFNPGQDYGSWRGVVLDLDNPKAIWHSTLGFRSV